MCACYSECVAGQVLWMACTCVLYDIVCMLVVSTSIAASIINIIIIIMILVLPHDVD